MVEPSPEDEFAEVPVVGDEDAPPVAGYGKHFAIPERVRIIVGDGGSLVSHLFEDGGQREVRALVEKEPHRLSRVVHDEDGNTASPSTSAWAYARHALTSSRVSLG